MDQSMGSLPPAAVSGASAEPSASAGTPPLVTADWLAAHLADPTLVVLDVRPAAQHAVGHIPGAVSADYATTGWRITRPDGAVGALPPVERLATTIGALGVGDGSRAVIVSDDFAAAARVYWTFKVLGHDAVAILDGGARAWAGPVQRGRVAPRPARFTPRYNAALRAELPEVAAAVADHGEALVDARPQPQWQGTAKPPAVRAYGHLPGAVWVDQRAVLTPDGHLQPKPTLQALFEPVGGKPAITYCNAGYLAATDWFVLSEVLGHPNTKLYDGSMSEWTADPSRPVAR